MLQNLVDLSFGGLCVARQFTADPNNQGAISLIVYIDGAELDLMLISHKQDTGYEIFSLLSNIVIICT